MEVAPTDGIEIPSPPDKPVPILTNEEIAALLKACAVGRAAQVSDGHRAAHRRDLRPGYLTAGRPTPGRPPCAPRRRREGGLGQAGAGEHIEDLAARVQYPLAPWESAEHGSSRWAELPDRT